MCGLNCWEFRKCGRELSGKHSDKLGVCPVATFKGLDSLWGGINGGRVCYRISKAFDLDNDESRRLASIDDDVPIDKNTHRCECCKFYEILGDESMKELFPSKFDKYL